MAIIATYLGAGRGSESVWFQGPKTSPKVPVILYGATSGGPYPKLMITLKKLAPRPLTPNSSQSEKDGKTETS